MVLFRPGPMIGEARGSIGGQTFSRNRGGMYIRARATPTNTVTQARTLARALFATISSSWETVLTPAQRSAWDAWAEFAPEAESLNKLGDTIRIGGKAAFQRINMRLAFAGLPQVTNTPDSNAPATPTVTAVDAIRQIGGEFLLTVSTTTVPASTHLQLFAGPYVKPGQTLLQKNNLRLVATGVAATNSVAGGASWVTRYGPVQAAQRIAMGVRQLRADGLISDLLELGLVTITQET